MARRPLLPPRTTVGLSTVAAMVAWVGVARGADVLFPEPVADALGLVAAIVALFGLPILVGQADLVVPMILGIGGLVVLVGFVNQLDSLGIGLALAIYLPLAVLVGLLAWAVNRYLLPALARRGQK